jgi:hypothetical protein
MRPIPLATAPEVRRIDRFEESRHRQLPPFVCDGGASQRTRCAIPCGTIVSSDACGAVPLLLQTLHEGVDVLVHVLLVGVRTHVVHPGGGILPDVTPALLQKVLVKPPIESADPITLLTGGLLRDALQGGWPCGSDPSCSGHVSCAGGVCRSAPSPCARLSRLRVR